VANNWCIWTGFLLFSGTKSYAEQVVDQKGSQPDIRP